jgi:hypothetical protein
MGFLEVCRGGGRFVFRGFRFFGRGEDGYPLGGAVLFADEIRTRGFGEAEAAVDWSHKAGL